MGLFGLFEKKICDICGEEIKLLGKRKVEDGQICSHCSGKLSPFFKGRKKTTLADIKEQLAYREANKQAVATFRRTRVIGETYKVYIDEQNGNFMVCKGNDIAKVNPDVIRLADVLNVEFDIKEHKSEEYKTVDGKRVSYSPRRYKYTFDFNMKIFVNHPYFDVMEFELQPGGSLLVESRNSRSAPITTSRPSSIANAALSAMIPDLFNPYEDQRYVKYKTMGEDIKRALLAGR